MLDRLFPLVFSAVTLVLIPLRCVGEDSVPSATLHQRQTLWAGKVGGYAAYRIPALIKTGDGRILAFCEARKNGAADQGDIDLVMRRSDDGGRTWSASKIVHEVGDDAPTTIGNPCPIAIDSRGGVELLFCQNNKRVFRMQTDDAGQTWSKPVELTPILDDFEYDVVRVATGPGHGLAMKSGRLIAPVWLSNRNLSERNVDSAADRYVAGVLYRDPDAERWRAGGIVPATLNRANESTVVELRDGRLLLNSRLHQVGFRAQSISDDGGVTLRAPDLVTQLPDVTCQGSMLRANDGDLYFSNVAGPKTEGSFVSKRRGLSLSVSEDDGRTWKRTLTLESGPSGYSDLVNVDEDEVGCLFETGSERYNEKIDWGVIEI